MALISGIGISLFAWINSNMITLQRVEAARARHMAIENSIEYMQNINPMLTPDGKVTLGDLHLSWNSTLKAAPVDIKDFSLYQVALYDVVLNGSDANNPSWFDFTMTLVAYKKVRLYDNPIQLMQ